jgi:hypothetical protein
MIIGVGFRARSGKDVIGQYLVDHHGFRRSYFAKSLKAACAAIFHLDDSYWYGEQKEVVHPYWKTTPRDIMQRVGTEAMRQGFDQDIWVKSLEWEILQNPETNFVICDVRFINEAACIKRLGGILWKVERPSVIPAPPSWWTHPIKRLLGTWEHQSERDIKHFQGWDAVILNDGTLDDLYQKIEQQIETIKRKDAWSTRIP